MPFDFQSVDMGQLLVQVTDEFSAVGAARQLTIQPVSSDLHVAVMLDYTTIMRVLRHLLGNAVESSPQGGMIILGMHHDDHAVAVSVSDQGAGIPEAECDTMFEKFTKSNTPNSRAGDTGLALAICRAVIRAHQGRIWAANRPEGGVVFAFALPLPRQDEAESDLVEVGEGILGETYGLATAESGEEALALAPRASL
jgi:signal transduction histidine kinase